jgi:hypothetical protein
MNRWADESPSPAPMHAVVRLAASVGDGRTDSLSCYRQVRSAGRRSFSPAHAPARPICSGPCSDPFHPIDSRGVRRRPFVLTRSRFAVLSGARTRTPASGLPLPRGVERAGRARVGGHRRPVARPRRGTGPNRGSGATRLAFGAAENGEAHGCGCDGVSGGGCCCRVR